MAGKAADLSRRRLPTGVEPELSAVISGGECVITRSPVKGVVELIIDRFGPQLPRGVLPPFLRSPKTDDIYQHRRLTLLP